MSYFEKINGTLSRFLNGISMASVLAMMLITCSDVILRPLGLPVVGAYEMAGFLGGVAVSFALARTTLEKGHIAVEFVVAKLRPPLRKRITTTTHIFSLGLCALISWQSAKYAGGLWESGEVSMTLGFPFYPVVYGIAFTFAATALVIAVDILKAANR